MNQYLEIASLLIPNKYTAIVSVTMSTIEILKTVHEKFKPEYSSIIKATNYQFEDPTLYSQLFQGSLDKETQKRKSISLKIETYKSISNFLAKYNFNQQLDIVIICRDFYSQQFGCCIFDLNIIRDNLQKYSQILNGIITSEQLNQTIDELSLLFIEYCKGQFNKQELYDEFFYQFNEISTKIYYLIIKCAKKQYQNQFNNLVKKIKEFYQNQKQNQIILETCNLIRQQKIPLKQLKLFISNFFTQNQKLLNDEISNFYNYKLTNVVIQNYTNKMIKYQLQILKDSFVTYLKNLKLNQEIEMKCENLFYLYFIQKQTIQGITNETYLLLYYVLLSQKGYEKNSIDILNIIADEISFDKITINSEDELIPYFTQLRTIKQEEIKNSLNQWKEIINEQTNIACIFYLFIHLSGWKFNNNQLFINNYLPINKEYLMNIISLLNDCEYGYFNQSLIIKFETIIKQIEKQIIDQQKQKNQKIQIILQETTLDIEFSKNEQENQFLYDQFKQKNLLCHLINYNLEEKTTKELIDQLLQDIHNNKLPNIQKPEQINFEAWNTDVKSKSPIVTLCITGFESNEESRQFWEELSKFTNVVMLHWKTNHQETGVKDKVIETVKQIILKSPLEVVSNGLKAYTTAPFEEQYKEAKIVGKYLAHLIVDKQLFSNSFLNIFCHGIGSIVIYEMIKEMDKITQINTFINDIVILGGMVDVRKLSKRRWNSVYGQIHNIYSKKDMVLKLQVNSFKIFDQLCGLNQVETGYKTLINHNLTSLINGHKDYCNHLTQILLQTDVGIYFKQYFQ